jgi:hypothetical protein
MLRAEDPCGDAVVEIDLDDALPYGQKPIDYFGEPGENAVSRLQSRLERGDVRLSMDEKQGYLPSLLEALDIPASSQMLVFSKTALNPKLVSPENPRAVYFNEECYVGFVPGGAALEIAVVDPQKGFVFYTLDQSTSKETKLPRLQRESQCLACHAGPTAFRVPGGLVRGFVTDREGNPLSGYSQITHDMPFEKRFGGWYVTGSHGSLTHRGNRIDSKTGPVEPLLTSPDNLEDLSNILDAENYPSLHSDLVAQLLLHHQIQGQNLMIRVGYEARFGKRSNAEDLLVRHLLFIDEAPLAEPIQGSTGFAEWFQKREPKDQLGRSLRDWELKTRLFKHRISYLIDTPLFDGLPGGVKRRFYGKLWGILTSKHPPSPFGKLSDEERKTIVEMLASFKEDLPPEWVMPQTAK